MPEAAQPQLNREKGKTVKMIEDHTLLVRKQRIDAERRAAAIEKAKRETARAKAAPFARIAGASRSTEPIKED